MWPCVQIQGDSFPSVKHWNFNFFLYVFYLTHSHSWLSSSKYLPSINMLLFELYMWYVCTSAVLILCLLHINCSYCLSFCCLNNADILFSCYFCIIHTFFFCSRFIPISFPRSFLPFALSSYVYYRLEPFI